MQQDAVFNRVMETETIQKNGASLKSHTSKGNFRLRNFRLFAVLAIITGFFTFNSCSEEEQQNSASLEVSPTSLNFGAEESDYQTVYVTSNVPWSPSTSTSWCKISDGYGGYAASGSIRIIVDKNTSTSSRNATIVIQGEGRGQGLQRTISVSQAGATTGGGGGTTAPATPTNVTATAQSSSSISVSWSAVTGATSYEVYYEVGSSTTKNLVSTVSSTSYTHTGLSASTTYYYYIKAINNAGASSFSSSAIATTTSGSGGGTTKPSAPTGVTASNVGSALIPEIRISWNSVSGATSYKVYRSSSASGTYSQIGSSTSYTQLSDISPLNGYNYYKVKAVNSAGESDYSSSASYNNDPSSSVAPCPVTYGSCTVSGSTMTLRWTVPTTYGCGTPTKAILRVRNPQSGVYADLQTLSGTATSVSFNHGMWIDSSGYVYVGIILENDKGSSGGVPKIYDTKNNKWIN